MTPSLTHCQNCFCVVQNSFRSRQITSAVLRFFFFFSLVVIAFSSEFKLQLACEASPKAELIPVLTHTLPSACSLLVNRPKRHAATPKGNLSGEAASSFQMSHRLSPGFSSAKITD